MKSFSSVYSRLLAMGLCAVATTMLFTNCAGGGFESVSNAEGDPLLKYAWFIKNEGQAVFAEEAAKKGFDLNISQTWADGYSGKGVRILISDDGVEDSHEDIKGNYLYGHLSKDYTQASPFLANASPPKTTADNHGTAVAGLIAAVANNGLGSRGVAFGASVVSANFLSSATGTLPTYMVDQASGNFDIYNMSWGSTQNELVPAVPSFLTQIRYGALNYRNGKGAIYVKAAGNDYAVECHNSSTICIGNSGFDSDNRTPFTIVTGALAANGYAASYSSMGSNLWISSFGGERGDDTPAMISTDRMGCTRGYAKASSSSGIKFQRGANSENSNCNYTATFNGTSSAAPVLSGVIALMLEANPELTWRDVKYILAKTADPVNYVNSGSISHPTESIPAGAVWERAWVVNGAGFKFHNYYGFGKVNVDKAVALAKNYSSTFGAFQEIDIQSKSGLNISIPDSDGAGVTDTFNISTNLKIESVQLRVYITHPNIADLSLELQSPSGTKSYLVNMNNSLRGIANYSGEIFLSNAFYQEMSQGTWTLKVIDGKTGNSGTITGWGLYFTGSN